MFAVLSRTPIQIDNFKIEMLKLLSLLFLVTLVSAGKSPNGEKYLASLTSEERASLPRALSEDALLDVPGLVDKYGYNAEYHWVTTEDGYIVTMHRIAGKKGDNNGEKKPAVLLMHGLMASSSSWVVAQAPGKGFGYFLADAGYDVWMGNARGNFYSKNHTTLSPKQRKFWRFSWHEIGYYDCPAMIDYILEKTGQDKLHYVGHSQGTTSFFVMTSTRPEYNEKIITMNALAPVAYMTNSKHKLILAVGKYATQIHYLMTLIGQNEFAPNTKFMAEFAHEHCQEDGQYLNICIALLMDSQDLEYLNMDMIPLYLSHNPNGASTRQFVHYAQEHYSGKFRNYDHGFIANYLIYKSLSPPNYRTKRITAPVALHFSDNDNAVNPIDVMRLFGEIVNPIGTFRVTRPSFTHTDFIWGIDAPELVYEKALEIMKEYDAKRQ